MNEVILLINFEQTGKDLVSLGIISNGSWENPTAQEVDFELEAFEELGDLLLEEVFSRKIYVFGRYFASDLTIRLDFWAAGRCTCPKLLRPQREPSHARIS